MASLVCLRHSYHQIRLQTTALNSMAEVPITSAPLPQPQVFEISKAEVDGDEQTEQPIAESYHRPLNILKVGIPLHFPN